MESTQLADQFMTGTDEEMIGVSKNDARAQIFEHVLGHALDAAQSSDGHEHRSFDRPVRCMQESRTGFGERIGFDDFEAEHGSYWNTETHGMARKVRRRLEVIKHAPPDCLMPESVRILSVPFRVFPCSKEPL